MPRLNSKVKLHIASCHSDSTVFFHAFSVNRAKNCTVMKTKLPKVASDLRDKSMYLKPKRNCLHSTLCWSLEAVPHRVWKSGSLQAPKKQPFEEAVTTAFYHWKHINAFVYWWYKQAEYFTSSPWALCWYFVSSPRFTQHCTVTQVTRLAANYKATLQRAFRTAV